MIIPSIQIPIRIKYYQEVIEKQSDPSPNVTKSNDIFLTPGNDEMVQHSIPINKSGLQEILDPWIK